MGEFLQECYLAAGSPSVARRIQLRVEATAGDLTDRGNRIHLLRSMLVPEDETWFLLWEADGIEAVHEVASRAGLVGARVTTVVALPSAHETPA